MLVREGEGRVVAERRWDEICRRASGAGVLDGASVFVAARTGTSQRHVLLGWWTTLKARQARCRKNQKQCNAPYWPRVQNGAKSLLPELSRASSRSGRSGRSGRSLNVAHVPLVRSQQTQPGFAIDCRFGESRWLGCLGVMASHTWSAWGGLSSTRIRKKIRKHEQGRCSWMQDAKVKPFLTRH